MDSRSKLAKRAGAAAFLLAFTNHCGGSQPGSESSPGSAAVQASGGVSGTPAANRSSSSAGQVAQPPAAGSSGPGASTSVRTTTNPSVGAAGSGNAVASSAVGGSTAVAGAAAGAPSGASAGGAGASAAAGSAGSAGSGADADAAQSTVMMAWPAVADFSMKGTFTAATQNNTGPMNAYTLFYPKEIGRDGLKHPSLTWGNGATTTPDLFSLLPLLASHGFVIIAANDSFVTSDEMKSGLDWLMAENDKQDSVLQQKLDPSKVAAMGYSLGSMGAFEMAADPRLKTTVHISGGAMDKSVLPNLKNPAAFFCGDSSDIAHDNCESDFEMAKVPVFYGVFPGDHLGILGSHATQINKAVATWLRWRLMDDATLSKSFVGKDCTVCQDNTWVVKQRELDTAP